MECYLRPTKGRKNIFTHSSGNKSRLTIRHVDPLHAATRLLPPERQNSLIAQHGTKIFSVCSIQAEGTVFRQRGNRYGDKILMLRGDETSHLEPDGEARAGRGNRPLSGWTRHTRRHLVSGTYWVRSVRALGASLSRLKHDQIHLEHNSSSSDFRTRFYCWGEVIWRKEDSHKL